MFPSLLGAGCVSRLLHIPPKDKMRVRGGSAVTMACCHAETGVEDCNLLSPLARSPQTAGIRPSCPITS